MLGAKDVFTFHDDCTNVKAERVRNMNYILKHYCDIFGRQTATIFSIVTAITYGVLNADSWCRKCLQNSYWKFHLESY